MITRHVVGGVIDEQLDFGIMQMPKGAAFAIGAETNTIPVTRQWLLLDGRHCLVEQTPFKSLQPLLKDLPGPPGQAGFHKSADSVVHQIASHLLLPPGKLSGKSMCPITVAAVEPARKGVATDWSTLTAQTNFVFKSDSTYYAASSVTLSST